MNRDIIRNIKKNRLSDLELELNDKYIKIYFKNKMLIYVKKTKINQIIVKYGSKFKLINMLFNQFVVSDIIYIFGGCVYFNSDFIYLSSYALNITPITVHEIKDVINFLEVKTKTKIKYFTLNRNKTINQLLKTDYTIYTLKQ